jgi:hypothetical protein
MTDAPSDRGSLTRPGTWSEPHGDWLPIARAVFCFAIAPSGEPQSTKTSQDDPEAFSIEAFEKFKSLQDEVDAEIADNETGPLSLRNLRTILRDKAGACRAEIDLNEPCFRFDFDSPADASTVMSFAPWHIALRRDPVEIDPEAYFNQGNGLVVVGDETATHHAQQLEAVCSAKDRFGKLHRQDIKRPDVLAFMRSSCFTRPLSAL